MSYTPDELLSLMESFAEATSSSLVKLAKKKELDPKAEVRNRGKVIFPAESGKVKDKKDHFPINTVAQARNALARANQFSSAPEWYKGTLQAFVSAVVKAVKQHYPSIDISKAAKKPGKVASAALKDLSNLAPRLAAPNTKQLKHDILQEAYFEVFERSHLLPNFQFRNFAEKLENFRGHKNLDPDRVLEASPLQYRFPKDPDGVGGLLAFPQVAINEIVDEILELYTFDDSGEDSSTVPGL